MLSLCDSRATSSAITLSGVAAFCASSPAPLKVPLVFNAVLAASGAAVLAVASGTLALAGDLGGAGLLPLARDGAGVGRRSAPLHAHDADVRWSG